MGLAAAKRRHIVQTDPNNINWARNTDTFGQKILRAHGWAPGDFLGAKDAAHAVYHTEASSSHIKVSLKEDNLGLGAKRNNGDQCTGLDAFQDLLGRLNGKTDATIEVEREARMAVKRNLYVERKFGAMKFVQGGWLVGDQETKALEEALAAAKIDKEDDVSDTSDSDADVSETTIQKSKKRKAEDTDESKDAERKKSKKRRAEDVLGGETAKDRQKREKKEKKAKKRGLKGDGKAEDGDNPVKEGRKERKESKSGQDEANDCDGAATDPAAKKSKKDKRKRKEDGGSKSADNTDTQYKRSNKKRRKEEDIPATASAEATTSEETAIVASATSTPTPAGSGTSTPNHHTSRRRFIAQKRAAFSDPKALAQIFMIKTTT